VPPPIRFEWDDAKAASNEAKHGVSFRQAIEVFLDPARATRYDARRDYGEVRLRTVGRSGSGLLFVCFTVRGDAYRLISARRANRGERRRYLDGAGGE